MGNEISRLSGFESESNRKDVVIANLQEEIAALTEKMTTALARKDSEFHQKLLSIDKDVGAKAEEIKVLKEEVRTSQGIFFFGGVSQLCHDLLSEKAVYL